MTKEQESSQNATDDDDDIEPGRYIIRYCWFDGIGELRCLEEAQILLPGLCEYVEKNTPAGTEIEVEISDRQGGCYVPHRVERLGEGACGYPWLYELADYAYEYACGYKHPNSGVVVDMGNGLPSVGQRLTGDNGAPYSITAIEGEPYQEDGRTCVAVRVCTPDSSEDWDEEPFWAHLRLHSAR